jgi:hypothetical protein
MGCKVEPLASLQRDRLSSKTLHNGAYAHSLVF